MERVSRGRGAEWVEVSAIKVPGRLDEVWIGNMTGVEKANALEERIRLKLALTEPNESMMVTTVMGQNKVLEDVPRAHIRVNTEALDSYWACRLGPHDLARFVVSEAIEPFRVFIVYGREWSPNHNEIVTHAMGHRKFTFRSWNKELDKVVQSEDYRVAPGK